ncbi:MAG: hypothetical protein NTY44_10495 [Deltaproteobacteria bacterium]|jgi:uncharacterized membrane protein required for colicin V production|nr:hypothetical protein [Deltaproteobacteria bacterium]
MKKLLFLVVVVAFLAGCAGADQSEFWKHSSMYQNTEHLKFSWSGYQDCGPEFTKATQSQSWWGETIKECKK